MRRLESQQGDLQGVNIVSFPFIVKRHLFIIYTYVSHRMGYLFDNCLDLQRTTWTYDPFYFIFCEVLSILLIQPKFFLS